MATEYHVLTTKAIRLGTFSCEDGFARYFCKNDTFIFRYIAFYWLFGILKNFRRFFRVFPDFGTVKPVQHKQKQRHRPKDNPLTRAPVYFHLFSALSGTAALSLPERLLLWRDLIALVLPQKSFMPHDRFGTFKVLARASRELVSIRIKLALFYCIKSLNNAMCLVDFIRKLEYNIFYIVSSNKRFCESFLSG